MQEKYFAADVSLVKVNQAQKDELYQCSWGNSSQCSLLLLQDIVL